MPRCSAPSRRGDLISGCNTLHRGVRQAVAELRSKLLEIRERHGGVAEAAELPEPEADEVERLPAIVFSDEASA